MGGRSAFNFEGDVLIFDTHTGQVRTEIETNEDYLEFQAFGHQCAKIRKNTVVALVEDEDRDPYLLEYTKGA